ncbi:MAG TPA: thioredoxin fold domain-containing protein [Mucilaginibacter sp.]|jgi:thioredoxin-related protein
MFKIFVSAAWLLLSCNFLFAQDKGIQFENDLSWQQVLDKAKAESKYIFVDCYATWCGPCKQMDRGTYPNEKVGKFFKAHFISVKVQMDSSKHDDTEVKAWYAEAHRLQKQFVALNGAVAYPTFLFFSPDGKIIHRFLGLLDPPTLISIGKEALDTNFQYYTLLEKYRNKLLADTSKPVLAIRAKLLGSQKLADSVGYDYVANYLLKLPADRLYTPVNWLMLDRFTEKKTDPGFSFMLRHANEINGAANSPYYIQKKQVKIILNNEVIPETKGKEMNATAWSKMEDKYGRKYGRLGKLAVLEQRLLLVFDKTDKQFTEYEKAYVLYFKNAGPLNVMHINNSAWLIFQHSDKPQVLALAIKVMEPHKEEDVQAMDTYANLLYKVGRKSAAVEWEGKAVAYENNHPSNPFTHNADPVFQQNLEKMQKGEKTW